jgi:hypothetical protein
MPAPQQVLASGQSVDVTLGRKIAGDGFGGGR